MSSKADHIITGDNHVLCLFIETATATAAARILEADDEDLGLPAIALPIYFGRATFEALSYVVPEYKDKSIKEAIDDLPSTLTDDEKDEMIYSALLRATFWFESRWGVFVINNLLLTGQALTYPRIDGQTTNAINPDATYTYTDINKRKNKLIPTDIQVVISAYALRYIVEEGSIAKDISANPLADRKNIAQKASINSFTETTSFGIGPISSSSSTRNIALSLANYYRSNRSRGYRNSVSSLLSIPDMPEAETYMIPHIKNLTDIRVKFVI